MIYAAQTPAFLTVLGHSRWGRSGAEEVLTAFPISALSSGIVDPRICARGDETTGMLRTENGKTAPIFH